MVKAILFNGFGSKFFVVNEEDKIYFKGFRSFLKEKNTSNKGPFDICIITRDEVMNDVYCKHEPIELLNFSEDFHNDIVENVIGKEFKFNYLWNFYFKGE